MGIASNEDRAALLLHLLGGEAAEAILSRLSPEQTERVRRRQQQLAKVPLQQEDVNAVLADFERFLRFARRAEQTTLRIAPESAADRSSPKRGRTASHRSGTNDATAEDEDPESVDNPLTALEHLESERLAGALWTEAPQTIALVIGCLSPDRAAQTLKNLPAEQRSRVFLHLNQKPAGSTELRDRVVRGVVEKARTIDDDALPDEESRSEQRMADVLRAMKRDERNQILEALEEHDAGSAARIKELLYTFEDIRAVADRSLQKLLSEIDWPTLAAALKGADSDLTDKVTRNLSRRAREGLKEEMELTGTLTQEMCEDARTKIAETMGRLDQEGELVMEQE